ncbi:Hypothetical protein LUCI_1319 [Lucifera butyrica]|uniref:Uncharacterized protein n=1 Tax=Lucifera butyrica TaxID=1351585 RepID=A0A498R3W8_9FIRM|nr:hypothetical protein [Lucifera butyrica]VBB06104.1 Hypothetical protein LUCI_1319 [Lucifera butyrica]
MFLHSDYSESQFIWRGVIVLITIILLGVVVAEKQLNGLTQREQVVQSFNLARNEQGTYTVYFLGFHKKLRALYGFGRITGSRQAMCLEAGNDKITIPLVLYFDLKFITAAGNVWFQQFETEALKTGKYFMACFQSLYTTGILFYHMLVHLVITPS